MLFGLPAYLVLLFLAAFVYLFVAVVLAVRRLSDTSDKVLARRIEQVATGRLGETDEVADIVKRHEMSGLHWLDLLLTRQAWSRRLNRTLEQADIRAPLGIFVLLALVLAVTGYLLLGAYTDQFLLRLGLAVVLALLPFKWIGLRKNKRMAEFERQLPEALELVGRALKAGHTFGSGMGMVVSEFADPIRVEFQKTLEEINFGVSVTVALDNLMERVDCPDLNFFVVTVKIQNETGGNLAEVVENISSLIRERFKLKGRVRVLSAEGRLTAWVLCLLPVGVCMAIRFANPGYLDLLFSDPLGRKLSYGALSMMTMGVLAIRRMIRIEV
jgi:tight adherence protein B